MKNCDCVKIEDFIDNLPSSMFEQSKSDDVSPEIEIQPDEIEFEEMDTIPDNPFQTDEIPYDWEIIEIDKKSALENEESQTIIFYHIMLPKDLSSNFTSKKN